MDVARRVSGCLRCTDWDALKRAPTTPRRLGGLCRVAAPGKIDLIVHGISLSHHFGFGA
jgi:hypothetical protein